MITLFRLLVRLPLALLRAGGVMLGLAAFLASPGYRSKIDANLQRAGLDRRLRWACARQAGVTIGELPFVWFGPLAQVVARVRCDDLAMFEQARNEGRGVLVLTPHLGSFEVAAHGCHVQLLADRQAQAHAPDIACRHQAVQQGTDRDDQDGVFYGGQLRQGGQAPGDDVLVRGEIVVWQDFPVGKLQQGDVLAPEKGGFRLQTFGLLAVLGDHDSQSTMLTRVAGQEEAGTGTCHA
ncbi:MAG: hypothetical protein ACO3Q7_12810 [Steroidobacteraceae bacterium]